MLIDTHCHLDFPDFDDERRQVIDRALDNGVARMITISTRIRRFAEIRTIAENNAEVWCSVGTHPHNAGEERGIAASEIIALAEYEKVVAIGEAGLDYHYDKAPRDAQAEGLRIHIDAARQTGLPLVIHARNADDDMAAILEDETGRGAFPFLMHCFSSGRALAETAVKLGGYVSFSGILTFKASEDIRSIARDMPLDRLLVETDAPYLAPMPNRGKRNEPAFVRHTAQVLADVHDVSFEKMAAQTTANAMRLFTRLPEFSA